MKTRRISAMGWMVLAALTAPQVPAQKVIDRIAARVDDDVILLSDIRELGEYQQLVDGKSESNTQLLDRLIDQWMVRKEADTARFPQPSDADVEQSLQRLKDSFASPQEYEDRRKQAGLTEAEVRRSVDLQLYLNNYLDSRFRPLVHVDQKAIEEFYNNRLVPRAKARGQAPPSLEAASDSIQEALTQQGINQQADRWLKESRARIQVQRFPDENEK